MIFLSTVRRPAVRLLLLAALSLAVALPLRAQVSEDAEQLGMALDYFQSGKYHECGLILRRLDGQYRLNPRFRAFLGLCMYYDGDYRPAAAVLDSVLPRLTAFSPQEQAVYYYAAAESHYRLQEYAAALPLYRRHLTLCREEEQADSYYRIGTIALSREQWSEALDNLQNALVGYRTRRPRPQERIEQIRRLIKSVCREMNNR